jgi:hypothetical protein
LHAENLRAVEGKRWFWISVSLPSSANESCVLPRAQATSLADNSMNINFRKIDVDAYDEDVLLETELYEPDPRGPQQVIEDAKAKAASVRTSLAK